MKRRYIVTFLFLIAFSVFLARPAGAGVGFGISIGGSHFGLSFGYSDYDYPVYGPGWASSSWSLDLNTALDGYGSWIEVNGLGRVWHPWVAADWRPYTYGRWVFTSLGWTWVAYEPWGYIPHHYGSWAMTSYGWVWAPGYTYYPANVTWLSFGASIGWYATPPYGWSDRYRAYRHGYRHGFNRGYGRGYRNGWDDARYANFIDSRRFTTENVARYVRPGDRYTRMSRSQIRVLRSGPNRTRIEHAAGRTVPRVRIDSRRVSISGRSVRAIRPHGVTTSISRYSRTTVRTALAPSVAHRLETRRGSTSAGSARTPVRSSRGTSTIQRRSNTFSNTRRTRGLTRTAASERTTRWTATSSRRSFGQRPSGSSRVERIHSRSSYSIRQPATRTPQTYSQRLGKRDVRRSETWTRATASRSQVQQTQRTRRSETAWGHRSSFSSSPKISRSTSRRVNSFTRQRSAVSTRRYGQRLNTGRATRGITQSQRRTRSFRTDRHASSSQGLGRTSRTIRTRPATRSFSHSRNTSSRSRAPSRRR